MQWWMWLIILVLVVAAGVGAFAFIQSRRRTGGIISTRDRSGGAA